MTGQLTFAFLTGALATVNPCGFAMLPTFLAFYAGRDSQHSAPGSGVATAAEGRGTRSAGSVWSGVSAGLALSAGFAGVFVLAGLLIAVGMRFVIDALPWAAVAVGAVLVAAGLASLTGRRLPGARLPSLRTSAALPGGGSAHGRLRLMAGYGVAYAVASLSCSLALLLAVVGQAVATGSPVALLAVFGAYAAGATVVLVLLAIAAALTTDTLARHLQRLLPLTGVLGALALIGAGGYLVSYWLPALSGGTPGGVLGEAMGDASGAVTRFATDHPLWLASAAATVVAAAALSRWRAGTTPAQAADNPADSANNTVPDMSSTSTPHPDGVAPGCCSTSDEPPVSPVEGTHR